MVLVRSSVRLYLKPTNYVDNVRQGNDHIEKGVRFEKKNGRMMM